jgi:protoheme IX farnesyltransferase
MILGILNVVLYNLVYTSLKRVSSLALIPGSLVGAVPPLIGFTAAGGSAPDSGILLFSLFMFLWQIPHFWLISIRYADDYRTAGFKLYNLFGKTGNPRLLVFLWILFSTVVLIGLSLYEVLFQWPLYLFLIPLNIIFILMFYSMLFRPENELNTKPAFILINSFSIAIMLLFIINSFISAL